MARRLCVHHPVLLGPASHMRALKAHEHGPRASVALFARENLCLELRCGGICRSERHSHSQSVVSDHSRPGTGAENLFQVFAGGECD